MSANKKTTYMTVDQIRKQERENRFKNLKFDDDKVYSVDEIRQAAVESQAKVNSFIMNLMTPEQLKGPRGNNHGYSSYEAYVEAMCDRYGLDEDQRKVVMTRLGFWDR